jgi:SAM-dependent methyltransferase
MADITATPGTSSCCTPKAQTTCCAPSEKAECCGTKPAGGSCGCAAGQAPEPPRDIREVVRDVYADAARRFAIDGRTSCGCTTGPRDNPAFGASLYGDATTDSAVEASLGCGVPTAVADLREGEVVLDLGSGAGTDVLISARRVGPTGRAIGLDMTEEMLYLARQHAAAVGVTNAEFLKGYIEDIPLPDESVDVVISNCVINLASDKYRVLAEAARVLRPGGRFAVSDVIADADMDNATRADMAAYTVCIAGAMTENEFFAVLHVVGLRDVEIIPTHRVHEHAASAIIRARKPVSA